MDIRQLTSFLAVARFSNFTKAAEFLNYSQSTVSEQIISLEKQLGVKLFERLGRKICLTENATKLMPYAEQITSLCTETANLFTAPDTLTGTLTVAAAETLCVFRLPILIKSFKEQHPDVQISLKVGRCPDFPGWLRKNSVDIAFSLNDETLQPDLICRNFLYESMAILCNPKHPLAQKLTIIPNDLSEQNLILTEQGCGYRAQFEAVLEKHQVRPQSIVGFGSIEAIKQCVKSGLGISFLPRIAVEKEFESKQLVELNWQGPTFPVEAQIIYHKNKWLSPALQAFIECAALFKTANTDIA